MIKSIDENAIDKVINFFWKICQKRDRTSYPIKKSKLDLEKSFIKALKHPDDKVLGYFKDDTLIGSINIFVEVQESYLRVITYIEKDFEEVMEQIISYLKEQYPAYKVHFCYPKENVTVIDYFEKRQYECIEASHDLRLIVKDVPSIHKDESNISRLTKNEFNSYAIFHDKHAGEEMYWNSSRLYKAFDSWYIYLYTRSSEIQGSILICKAGADAIEIFGLFVEETMDQTNVMKELLAYSIHKVIEEEQDAKQAIFFVEEQNSIQYEIAKQMGFEDKGGFRCYSIDL